MPLLPNLSAVEKLLSQQTRSATGRLGEQSRANMKERIMATVKQNDWVTSLGYGAVVSKLQMAAAEVTPRPSFKVSLREKLAIVSKLDTRLRKSRPDYFSVRPGGSFLDLLSQIMVGSVPRRLAAAGILSFFVIALIGNIALSPDVSYARYDSYLEDVTGPVIVERDGRTMNAYKGLVLKQKDVLKTLRDAKASVRFLDQSVARLAENTVVEIASQKIDQINQGQTVVEIVLDYGRLWTRVVNLTDNESRFEVKTPAATAVAKRRAAFDVMVSAEGKSLVTAVHNRVDVRVAGTNKVVETTLVKGFSAEVKPSLTAKAVITPAPIENNNSTERSDSQVWVEENLTKDVAYIAQVKEENKEALRDQAGVASSSPTLNTLKQLTDSTSLVLSLSPVEKNKKLLALAEQKLGEAAVSFEQNNTEKGVAAVNEFLTIISTISNWIKEVEPTSPQQVIEVKALLQALIAQSHKNLSLILPTDKIYPLKDSLSKAGLLIADGPVEKAEEQLNTATEKLFEAHDLVEQGNTPAATQQIDKYKDAQKEVVDSVKLLRPDEKEKAVEVLLDAKKEDIKTLEAITEAQSPEQVKDIKVEELKKEGLTQIGEAVLDTQNTQKGLSSPELLQKIDAISKVDINGKQAVEFNLGKFTTVNGPTTDTFLRNAAPEQPKVEQPKFIMNGGFLVPVIPVPPQTTTVKPTTTTPLSTPKKQSTIQPQQ